MNKELAWTFHESKLARHAETQHTRYSPPHLGVLAAAEHLLHKRQHRNHAPARVGVRDELLEVHVLGQHRLVLGKGEQAQPAAQLLDQRALVGLRDGAVALQQRPGGVDSDGGWQAHRQAGRQDRLGLCLKR